MSKYSLDELQKNFRKRKLEGEFNFTYDYVTTYIEGSKTTTVYFNKGYPVCEEIIDYQQTWDGSKENNSYYHNISK
jgi:hypothetical protein